MDCRSVVLRPSGHHVRKHSRLEDALDHDRRERAREMMEDGSRLSFWQQFGLLRALEAAPRSFG